MAEARGRAEPRRGKEISLAEATTEPGTCQVGSKTDRPCPHRAVVEIRGIPFCERCAREQEAYFAVGEMSQETVVDRGNWARGLHRIGPLVEALNQGNSEVGKPGAVT